MAAPFRLGFFLKIALVAALTQPGFYSVIVSYPMQGVQAAAAAAMRHKVQANFAPTGVSGIAFAGPATVAGFMILAIVLFMGLLVWVLATYFFCRLRFALFDLIVYRHGRVREAWGKYGRQTWRYFGVVLLSSLVFLVIIGVTAAPFLIRMMKEAARAGGQGPNPNPWPMIASMLPFIGVCLLLGLAWMIVDALLQDFVLPPIAIEDAPIESALGRFTAMVREDAGSVAAYVLLRFVVAVAISWALMLVVAMILGASGLGGLAIGFGLYRALWSGGIGPRVVFIAIVSLMALLLLVVYLLAMAAVYGTTAVFKGSYAVYFYGSRYRALGDLLEPPDEMVGVRVEPPMPSFPPMNVPPPPVW